MRIRINKTIISPVIMFVFSLAVWFAIPLCIAQPASTGDIGPRAFPRLICVVITVLCIFQLAAVLIKVKNCEYVVIDMAVHGKVFLAALLALLAVVFAKFMNPLLTAMVCGFFYLSLLRIKSWKYYLALLLTGGVLFALMKYIMHIRF